MSENFEILHVVANHSERDPVKKSLAGSINLAVANFAKEKRVEVVDVTVTPDLLPNGSGQALVVVKYSGTRAKGK